MQQYRECASFVGLHSRFRFYFRVIWIRGLSVCVCAIQRCLCVCCIAVVGFFFFRSRGKRTYFFSLLEDFARSSTVLPLAPSSSCMCLIVHIYCIVCTDDACISVFGRWYFVSIQYFVFFLLSLLCLALRVYNIKCHLGFMFGAPFNTISFRSTTSNATCSEQYDSYGFSARIEMAAKLLVQNSIEYKRLHFMQ